MNVKVCGITNLEDALFAEQCGADYLGFIFAPHSPRFIDYDKAGEIIKRLTCSKAVGVFTAANFDEIDALAKQISLHAVQLYATLTQPLQQVNVIQAVPVEQTLDARQFNNPYADYYLLDSAKDGKTGGLGVRFDWSLIPGARDRLFLAGGINLENLDEALHQNTYAIDVNSGVEILPGKKDHQALKTFFEKVEKHD